MKRSILLICAVLVGCFWAGGCSGGEEPYVIEGPTADNPSVAGTTSQGGDQTGAQAPSKPSAPTRPTKEGR